MAEEFSQDAEATNEELVEIVVPPKRSLIARLGCWILVAIWFTVLLTPCAFFYLAGNGEIRIWHSDIPEPEAHPRLLISLVSEIDDRGFRITNSTIIDPISDDNLLCAQTNVNYIFWQSEDKEQNAVYCECYQRESTELDWVFTEMIQGECQN